MKYTVEAITDIHIFKEETNGFLLAAEEQGEYVAVSIGHEDQMIDRKLDALEPVVWFDKKELGQLIETLVQMHGRMNEDENE